MGESLFAGEDLAGVHSPAARHNILDFCARVPARKAELGPGSTDRKKLGVSAPVLRENSRGKMQNKMVNVVTDCTA